MRVLWVIAGLVASLQLTTMASIAQGPGAEISAENLHRLLSHDRIDFADFDAVLEIGWFASNDDATEILVIRPPGELYRFAYSSVSRDWSYRKEPGVQSMAVIDAVYVQDEPMVLHLLDGRYFINENPLTGGYVPVAIFNGLAGDDLFVEAHNVDGKLSFLHYGLKGDRGEIHLENVILYPTGDDSAPSMRIGRIDFPAVITSSLSDGLLDFRIYPGYFSEHRSRKFQLENGPAVFGAVNLSAASHLAWSDPQRERLNLLNLVTGENRILAAIEGAYAQYLLLSQDASAVLAANLDFEPVIVAWNAQSGERYDLGPYRKCGRIPDKVELSRDGKALIIGCDTGLDIWRVIEV